MEARSTPSASRFYELTPEQVKRLDQALGENVTWSYGNTCASWATSTVNNVTGQSLDAGELLFTDTPRELIESIRKAERVQPTSPSQPQPAAERPETSIPSLSDASESLHQQALAGVHALDVSLGRASDQSSQRMAASLTQLARAEGLERIDHVVLGSPSGQPPRPEDIFVVQGAMDDPGPCVPTSTLKRHSSHPSGSHCGRFISWTSSWPLRRSRPSPRWKRPSTGGWCDRRRLRLEPAPGRRHSAREDQPILIRVDTTPVQAAYVTIRYAGWVCRMGLYR